MNHTCNSNCNHKKHNTYIPLHGHSTYSFGDGVAKIDDIIKRTKEINADAVSLTEHGNMSSFYKFYKAAKEKGVKPILGCELYLNDLYYNDNDKFLSIKRMGKSEKEINNEEMDSSDDEYGSSDASNNHFLTYAINYKGLQNIIQLSNIGFENFYRKPLVSSIDIFSILDENNIVTTGCLQSKFNQLILNNNEQEAIALIKKYKDRFGENFYLEVQLNQLKEQEQINLFYKKIFHKVGVKPVFALDYHYTNKEDWYIQYLLYVIKQRQTINSYPEQDWFYNVRDLYIKEIDELYDRAKKYNMDVDFFDIAIDSTFEIRDKVNIEIPVYSNNFPKFIENKQESIDLFSTKLKYKFLEKVNNGLIPNDKLEDYLARLKYETDIIISKDFVDYFLILDDLLTNFVYKTGGATGAGRGSSGGSLVLFVLDITKIDPIRHKLIFERFLNPARVDPADVDMDIDSETQKEVENYLKQKFGKDKVCHIANFIKFGPKTIIKDLCRIFELDYGLSNKLTSYFDVMKADASIDNELKKALMIAKQQKDSKLIDFIELNKSMFVKYGDKLNDMIRQTGKHASGILISNKKLIDSDIPILKVKGDLVTAVQEGGDEREVSELGYCKLDILGLKTASIINETFKLIQKHHNIKDIEQQILLSKFDDEAVYREFELGNCRDIFQFGSDNMISLIKTIKPTSEIDLSTINALFRPAIIQAGGIDEYIENRNNPTYAKEKLDQVHPKLWPILEESFGVPIFQEQIMFIVQAIGGFSLAEADKARKILKLLHKGNQDKTDAFFKMLDKFKEGAKKNGVGDEELNWLLDILAKYSEYSFNKSHSLAYALNAYIAMYLKVHYKNEYYATLFNYSTKEEISWYIKQSKLSGIILNEFKMKKTSNVFSVDYENNSIKLGLNMIKGISSADINKINSLTATNLIELVQQVSENKISKRSYEPLARLNYFSEIFDNAKVLEIIFNSCKKLKKKETFENKIDEIITENENLENYTVKEYQQFEKQYLQFYLSEHPFEKMYLKLWQTMPEVVCNFNSPKNSDNLSDGNCVMMGVINDININKSKKTKKEYYKLILEDDEKQINITIFNSKDIVNINVGDTIAIAVSKNSFGFTKVRGNKIYKLI